MITLKIFVSSPGDVGPERGICQRVFSRTELEFRGLVHLEPVFWEFEPLRATGHFQPQIPRASETDLCIFLMWARFGSPLPPDVASRADGSPYLSGTEFEFEDAISSYAARNTPDILVYRKRATPPDAARRWEEFRAQYDLVESFFKRWFQYENGSFKSAFYEFDEPARFEKMLEPHLRKWIQEELQARGVADAEILSRAPWKGSPFRGLEAFSVDDGLIFCGRTQATTELLTLLSQRAKADPPTPFVLLSGASGTGKSSLVRAGLLPLISTPHVVEGVAAWRFAIARPSEGGSNPLYSLATALMADKALPELARREFDATRLAAVFAEMPEQITPATVDILGNMFEMAMASPGNGEPNRLLIIVDQLEELFTNDTISVASRFQFLRTLHALVHTGRCWVVATVRADFYPRLVALGPVFCDLCPREAVFELRPPNASEISDIIRRPAALAGLEYERRHDGAEGLDDVLRDAAAKNPDALSLLEFALEELYRSLKPGSRVLTFNAYDEIGGLEGALERRADAVLSELPQAAQAALPVVLSLLTRFDLQTGATTQRRVPYDVLAANPNRRTLVDHFTDKRLFVRGTDEQGTPTIGVVHEALLLRWKRALEWSEANRRFLRWRASIVAAESVWREQGTPDGHLIAPGKHLKEAVEILSAREAELGEPEKAFIRASITAARKSSMRLKTMAAAAAVLAVALIGAAIWYYDARVRIFVTYFDDWEHRWGVPIGVRPVAPAAVRARLATVKLEHRGRNGPVVRMTYIGPNGGCGGSSNIELPMLEDENTDLGGRRRVCSVDFSYVGSTLATETFRDRAGFELFSVAYQPLRWVADQDGRDKPMLWASLHADAIARPLKTGASDIRYILVSDGPFAGMIEREEYFSSAGEPRPNSSGDYGSERAWFAPEFSHSTTNLGEDGKPRHGDDDQVATIRYLSETDNRGGRTLTITRFDAAGQRAARKGGEWKTVRTYEPNGLRIETRSFDINERPLGSTRPPPTPLLVRTPTSTVSLIAKIRYAWHVSPEGSEETRRYFDAADRPVRNEDGVARLAIRYDGAGREIERRLFDESDQAVETRDGLHHWSYTFDAYGNTTLTLNLNKNDKPSPRRPSGGGWRSVRAYDPDTGKLKMAEETYVDELGHPRPSGGKVARTELHYDERENRIERRLYDADGKLTIGRDCWAVERVKYDGFGRAVEFRYYDAAEKPTSPIAPYLLLGAITRTQYNSRGQRLSTSYWDEDGQPIQAPRGVARLVDLYDEQGRRWQRSYFDINNRLTMNALANLAMMTIAYDENGQTAMIEYTDSSGRPVDYFTLADRSDGTDSILAASNNCGMPPARHSSDLQGFARTTYRYKGTRMVEKVERKANGEAVRYNYDDEEREIRTSYLDGSDRLRMNDEIGYAERRREFDSAGRLILLAFYDATGGLTVLKDDGFAKAVVNYLPDGSEAYQVFGSDDKPIQVAPGKGGWARLILRPRDAKGERRGVYGFLDGRIAAAFLDDRSQQLFRPGGLRACIQSLNERLLCYFIASEGKPARREWHDVIVDEIAPGSVWALAGLRPGDSIRGLDGAPFGILDELVYQLRASADVPHSLHVHRGNNSGIVQVKAGKLDDIRLRLETSPAD